jgi:hypothetical protein
MCQCVAVPLLPIPGLRGECKSDPKSLLKMVQKTHQIVIELNHAGTENGPTFWYGKRPNFVSRKAVTRSLKYPSAGRRNDPVSWYGKRPNFSVQKTIQFFGPLANRTGKPIHSTHSCPRPVEPSTQASGTESVPKKKLGRNWIP